MNNEEGTFEDFVGSRPVLVISLLSTVMWAVSVAKCALVYLFFNNNFMRRKMCVLGGKLLEQCSRSAGESLFVKNQSSDGIQLDLRIINPKLIIIGPKDTKFAEMEGENEISSGIEKRHLPDQIECRA